MIRSNKGNFIVINKPYSQAAYCLKEAAKFPEHISCLKIFLFYYLNFFQIQMFVPFLKAYNEKLVYYNTLKLTQTFYIILHKKETECMTST